MKLISFERNGKSGFGVLKGNGVIDLGAALHMPDLKTFLAGDDALARAEALLNERSADFALDSVDLLPVIPNPEKIWCCGLNYADHVRETNREVTERPTFFLRVAASQVAHGQAIVRPTVSKDLDFEAEIAVIIGKGGRHIAEADAFDHIAGYACYNDGTVRDWQRHTSQWIPGKNFWRTGGFGPWMVTADEIPAHTVMTLVSRLNGVEMQRTTTELMIHSIARQIAYTSDIAPLEAGDVIVTGTPGGVGARRIPPVWMKPGDVIEIEVDRIGVLRNTIADEA